MITYDDDDKLNSSLSSKFKSLTFLHLDLKKKKNFSFFLKLCYRPILDFLFPKSRASHKDMKVNNKNHNKICFCLSQEKAMIASLREKFTFTFEVNMCMQFKIP